MSDITEYLERERETLLQNNLSRRSSLIHKGDTTVRMLKIIDESPNFVYKHLINKDIDSIIDDTDENFSSKMKKFNLIGIPYQILLGKKSEGNFLEFRELGKDPQNLSIEQITKFLTEQKEKI